nr:type ISP restriction/modification enzyme [Candidatus Rhodoblastus alkanivorans]
MPYYVANLNIEATYATITGQFGEYPNLCFVDTLDNVKSLGIRTGQHVGDLFGSLSEENIARITRQNNRKISIVIGNPPYNANQQNENDNNKNREYAEIDSRIKDTYIKQSTAQKTKLYDMYARFFRWASDRMHDDGVLAFITNRSFIDSRTFDGFRRCVAQDFAEIYVVDLGGDVRANPKLSGTKHNVFGIQTGVAISFMVKKRALKSSYIFYARRPEMDTAEDKLAFLGSTSAAQIQYEQITPDKSANWVNLTDNDWDSLIPVADKRTKASTAKGQEKAIFKLFSLGVVTNRDEWVYSCDDTQLEKKVGFLIDSYNPDRDKFSKLRHKSVSIDKLNTNIKWTRAVKRDLNSGKIYTYDRDLRSSSDYRPFTKKRLYFSGQLNEMVYQVPHLFGPSAGQNIGICYVAEDRALFSALAVTEIPNKDFFMPSAAQVLSRSYYSASNGKQDNITDWALKQFEKRYGKTKAKPITKDAIFHYVYGVLHDPTYREKYAQNLKREFPRLPFYPDFWSWADWGDKLMRLHIGFETVDPWPLARVETPDPRARAAGVAAKPILKSLPNDGIIKLDSETTLTGIPPEAFAYRLGNRSGLDWILDQYKEKTPKDPTIREKFNTYRFADYKEKVIDLIARVTRVSVETMAIASAMKEAKR